MNPEVMQSWAVEALVASSLLILIVLLARGPAQRFFGARIAYALWALPALRMMLPRVPGLDAGRLHLDLAQAMMGAADTAPVLATPAVAAAAIVPQAARLADAPVLAQAAPHAVDWGAALLALWLGGAALHLGWHMLAHRRFLRRIKADAVVLRRDCGITILTGPAVPGPLATGLFERTILLPADFTDRYRPRERRLVLAHEVAHHCRGDLFANALALVVLSLHWFNPLAHRAYRLFRADQELACDETVLADEPADARYHYGQAIVKSVAPRFPAAACAMHGAGLLKQRLRMMTRMSGGVLRLGIGALAGAAMVAGGLALTASGAAAATDLSAVMPVPPVPPLPPLPPVPGAPLVTPPAPPVPPVAPRGGHHHVMITDRAIMVDGRTIDPDSREGREVRRAADEARREAAQAEREARREAADTARDAQREAAHASRDAQREALAAADEARRAGLESARAAREAAARVDARGIVRASLHTARASLERSCPNGRRAAQAIADDHAAIAALAANCVDRQAIRAEVRSGLARARAGIDEAEASVNDF